MFYHSQVFKKKITTQSRQTTHQPPIYKETIKWGQALPLKNWKSVVSCLTLQEQTFLVTQLVGLLLRAPWSKYMGTWKWMFFKIWKIFPPSLPTQLSPQSTAHPQILEYIWCIHLLQIILTLPNLIILSGLPAPFLLDKIWN